MAEGRERSGTEDQGLAAAERAAAEEAYAGQDRPWPDEGGDGPPDDLSTATRRALRTLPGRSPRPAVCPFLRAGEAADAAPGDGPDAGHRCAALAEPLVLGFRQQGLVCFEARHVDCPRYRAGEERVRRALAPGLGRRRRPAPAVVLAGGLLLGAVLVAVWAAGGGLSLPAGPGAVNRSTPSPVVASTGAGPTALPTPSPTPAVDTTPSPSPGQTPASTAEPTATPAPSVLPVAWQGLPRCPAPDDCYVYRVQKNDTLHGIATRFLTTLPVLLDLNPEITQPSTIHVGDRIRVPPPPA